VSSIFMRAAEGRIVEDTERPFERREPGRVALDGAATTLSGMSIRSRCWSVVSMIGPVASILTYLVVPARMSASSARPAVSLPSWSFASAVGLSGTAPPNDGRVQSSGQNGPNSPPIVERRQEVAEQLGLSDIRRRRIEVDADLRR
jgi:hypothetical protein